MRFPLLARLPLRRTLPFALLGTIILSLVWYGSLRAAIPNVTVSLTDTRTIAEPGEELTYTIKIVNSNPGPLANVTVDLTLDGDVTLSPPINDGGTATASGVTWAIAALPTGTTYRYATANVKSPLAINTNLDTAVVVTQASSTASAGDTTKIATVAPVAVDDAATTSEDTAKTISVLSNDTDGNGDGLTVTNVTTPANGTATLNADGTITYAPSADYYGKDSFTYTVGDAYGGTDTATVNLTVYSVIDAPVIEGADVSGDEDTAIPLTLSIPSPSAAGAEQIGDVTISGIPAGATLSAGANNGDGSWTLTPAQLAGLTITPPANSHDDFALTVSVSINKLVLQPEADAYAASWDANGNYGSDTSLYVQDSQYDSYLRFNLAALPQDADTDNAMFSISYYNGYAYGGDGNHYLYFVADDSWSENGLTWNNKPALGADLGYWWPWNNYTPRDWRFDLNVKNQVQSELAGDQQLSLAVHNPGNYVGYYYSREYSDATRRPRITVPINAVTATKTVNVAVNPVNDAPVVADQSFTIAENSANGTVVGTVVASDVDGDALTYSIPGFTAASPFAINPTTGEITVNNSAVLDYDPEGRSFDVTVQVSDGNDGSDTATITITLSNVNEPPVAVDDPTSPTTWSTLEDTALDIKIDDLLANDSDPDGNLNATSLAVGGTTAQGGTVAVMTDNDGNAIVRYTPAAGFVGTDTFTYTVYDGGGLSDEATVTIEVQNVNAAPVAEDDPEEGEYVTDEDTPYDGIYVATLLGNDQDEDNNLDPSTFKLLDTTTENGGTVEVRSGPDGDYIYYVPAADWSGTDTFTYEVCDTEDACDEATVTVIVNPVNDAPVVGAGQSFEVAENSASGTVVGTVSASDPEEMSLSYAIESMNPAGPFAIDELTGEITVNANNALDYEQGPRSYTLTVRVCDINLMLLDVPWRDFRSVQPQVSASNDPFGSECSLADVTITVTNVNEQPTAQDDTYDVDEAGTLTANNDPVAGVLNNDTDVDGDDLTVSTTPVDDVDNGTLNLNADGTFIYTPDAGYLGQDQFTYEACDPAGLCDQAVVTITVNDVNAAPVADNDGPYEIDEDQTLNVSAANGVLSGDTDAENNSLSAVIVTGPARADDFALNADGSFSYTPEANFNGTDSFTYKANDGVSDSNVVTVQIIVKPVNDTPVATNDGTYNVNEDAVLTVPAAGVLSNDNDVDRDTLTSTIVAQPSNGILTLDPNGAFSYDSDDDYFGSDSFTYRVSDGTATSNTATVTINVQPINDAPSFTKGADPVSVPADYGAYSQAWAQSLSKGPANEASQTLRFEITNNSKPDLFTVAPALAPDGTLSFTTEGTKTGTATITARIRDDGGVANGGQSTSPTQTFDIVITPPRVSTDPTGLNFHTQRVNSTSTMQAINYTNNDTQPMTINSIAVSGDFARTTNCPINPSTLAAGASCTIGITFTPTSLGSKTGAVTIRDSLSSTSRIVQLFGMGVEPGVYLSSTSLDFGTQRVALAGEPQTVVLSNNGNSSLRISKINITGDFAQTSDCPAVLAPDARCTISIIFTPTQTGARTGTLTIVDDANGSPRTVSLMGTGQAADQEPAPTRFSIFLPLMMQ